MAFGNEKVYVYSLAINGNKDCASYGNAEFDFNSVEIKYYCSAAPAPANSDIRSGKEFSQ